ncbi:prepilin-type N-terminal cleavage/methylation domain-containing protein [Alteromonas sp. S015]|uniref:prepilin-type N-terminal cleavage/methylation domain-containing protein n=1 Tax=Alteromonas sp. S015 TaxID=3117401 RepID=UPI002FE07843
MNRAFHYFGKLSSKGYTLLELLVVLVLMGLLMGIATPKVMQLYQSVQFSLERDDILFQLENLSFNVYKSGQPFELHSLANDEEQSLITLPQGWVLDPAQTTEITYSSLGFCMGGEARFVKENRELLLTLTPPSCTVQVQ